ncbi:peptide-methionine (S)-S-oxide reductase MsrA [Candidatus Woesearchaeota archaeon]|nr:peptide-methionine (S)-S-oxide reductase MsrA [Candidatus Woesearchaeota archaeon]
MIFTMPNQKTQLATFAAGCFWGVEAAFRKVKGVVDAIAGYSGGKMENPSYEEVCTDKTGHAEAVQVEYDPSKASYEELLDVFWSSHDPTQLNRQGPDVGTQYRSVIFYHNEKQKETAMKSKEKLQKSGKFSKPIVTEIVPAKKFYRAEEYHQRYLEKRGLFTCHT